MKLKPRNLLITCLGLFIFFTMLPLSVFANNEKPNRACISIMINGAHRSIIAANSGHLYDRQLRRIIGRKAAELFDGAVVLDPSEGPRGPKFRRLEFTRQIVGNRNGTIFKINVALIETESSFVLQLYSFDGHIHVLLDKQLIPSHHPLNALLSAKSPLLERDYILLPDYRSEIGMQAEQLEYYFNELVNFVGEHSDILQIK